mmetsp:Transcript_90658/g.261226  ORF Transcript_90658/g.261226 Transcript_90658/m.261226 type:complete len:350 (-) Transcript_90658:352-1401(-)
MSGGCFCSSSRDKASFCHTEPRRNSGTPCRIKALHLSGHFARKRWKSMHITRHWSKCFVGSTCLHTPLFARRSASCSGGSSSSGAVSRQRLSTAGGGLIATSAIRALWCDGEVERPTPRSGSSVRGTRRPAASARSASPSRRRSPRRSRPRTPTTTFSVALASSIRLSSPRRPKPRRPRRRSLAQRRRPQGKSLASKTPAKSRRTSRTLARTSTCKPLPGSWSWTTYRSRTRMARAIGRRSGRSSSMTPSSSSTRRRNGSGPGRVGSSRPARRASAITARLARRRPPPHLRPPPARSASAAQRRPGRAPRRATPMASSSRTVRWVTPWSTPARATATRKGTASRRRSKG